MSLNSRSDITISGFTGTAGSLTMNVAGTLLNSALIYVEQPEAVYTVCITSMVSILPATV